MGNSILLYQQYGMELNQGGYPQILGEGQYADLVQVLSGNDIDPFGMIQSRGTTNCCGCVPSVIQALKYNYY